MFRAFASTVVLASVAALCDGATVVVTTADGVGADADVRGLNPDDQSDVNRGGGHNMSARHYTDRHEKFWVRFQLPDEVDDISDARLELFWNQSWPVILSFEVFGLLEAEDYGSNSITGERRLGEDWAEDQLTWNNAPGNDDSPHSNEMNGAFAQPLFRFHSPRNYDPQSVSMPTDETIFPPYWSATPEQTRQRVETAQTNLVDFLNADTNGLVTFMVRRPPGGDCMDCVGLFAAKENTDLATHPPRLVLVTGPLAPVTLLSRDSDWNYLDRIKNELSPAGPLDYPSDAAGRAWYDPEFNVGASADRSQTPPVDLPWLSGAAPLGDGTIDGATLATRMQGVDDAPDGTSNDVTTYLFRREFELPNPAEVQELHVHLLSDDGGILYINGQEVLRTPNVPAGAITTTTVVDPAGSEVYRSYMADQLDMLRAGTNSVAFELHQVASTSSDVAFDLELTAVVVPEPATLVLLFFSALALAGARRRR